MRKSAPVISVERIEQSILLIRGQKVMLDGDLSALYGVQTRDLNKLLQETSTDFQVISCFS